MAATHTGRLFLGLLENVPSIMFLGLMQAHGNLRLAGWVSAASAAVALSVLLLRRAAHHPILLGLNLFMLIAAPSIEVVYALGFETTAGFLLSHIQAAVMLSILIVGVALTMVSPRGFIGVENADQRVARHASFLMLVLSAAAVIWSVAFEGNRLLAIGLPLLLLFGLRQYLIAQIADRKSGETDLSAAALPVAGTDASDSVAGT